MVPEERAASTEAAIPEAAAADAAAGGGFSGYVVGIGASAGGLDALERLFGALPADSGAAFVVIQHLSPDHKSMMDNLLARYTAMPVRVAEEGMPLAANAVFLIPPAKSMRLAGERLRLSPKPEHGLSLPIDIFFNSMAEQCADRGVAVVLSGTGSDGSRGLPAVNAAGGFVFVQDPASARFDGMPRSAIATGLADVTAPAEELARRLLLHLRTPRGAALRLPGSEQTSATAAVAEPLEGIFELLLASSGIDFRDYKPNTVLRRIERRMQVLRVPTLAAYHERLAQQSMEAGGELALLKRELLIPVTRFFRDAEVWEHLASQVVAPLVAEGAPATMEPLRAWVACCATGEEAYTLAILVAEAFRAAGRTRPVKIFATDVEASYLEQAAAGHYPDTIAAEVSPERLQRWFVEHHGGYSVRPEIRQMVIFARHHLVADPPFTRMDIVTCRNALIYFQGAAQERALRRLQYALRVGGHLLLGPSESLGAMQRDFTPLPGRHKIYRSLRSERLVLPHEGLLGRHHGALERRLPRRRGSTVGAGEDETQRWLAAGQRELTQAYVPPSMLVGPGRELLHVQGDFGGLVLLREGAATLDVLKLLPGDFGGLVLLREGAATLDVLKLLPAELAGAAAVLLQAAPDAPGALYSAPLPWPGAAPGGADSRPETRRLRLVARPVHAGVSAAAKAGAPLDPEQVELPRRAGATLLSFETLFEHVVPAPDGAALVALSPEQLDRVELLERELELTHESLQATIEELETANEELQATNEELMASNEELQSTNEELQSVNEELYTVNAEYQEKVDVLNSVNADLENVAKATATPTLFVDAQLRVQRFTPEATQLFKLREGDQGRALDDFAHTLEYPELYADIRRTLAEQVVIEREVPGRLGVGVEVGSDGRRWWLVRMQPYAPHAPTGPRAVLSFVDVTALKDTQRLQAVIDSLPEHLAVLDGHGTIVQVNQAWRRFAAANGDPELRTSGPGSNYLAVCASSSAAGDPDAREAQAGMAEVLAGTRSHFTLQYPCDTPQGRLWFLMHVAPVQRTGGGAVVSHIDITPWMTRNNGNAAAAGGQAPKPT